MEQPARKGTGGAQVLLSIQALRGLAVMAVVLIHIQLYYASKLQRPDFIPQFNIGAAKLNDELHEVLLRVEVRATADGQTAFAVDLLYAGLIGIRNVPEDQLQAFLLAEAPRMLFPFARCVKIEVERSSPLPKPNS